MQLAGREGRIRAGAGGGRLVVTGRTPAARAGSESDDQ